jgi:hypothetical protein
MKNRPVFPWLSPLFPLTLFLKLKGRSEPMVTNQKIKSIFFWKWSPPREVGKIPEFLIFIGRISVTI